MHLVFHAAELRKRTLRNLGTWACIMGSHSNVGFEPVSSVFIGSVHDRMTEVVALGSGGLICCGFACLQVRRRLHRKSYAILMDRDFEERRVQVLQ